MSSFTYYGTPNVLGIWNLLNLNCIHPIPDRVFVINGIDKIERHASLYLSSGACCIMQWQDMPFIMEDEGVDLNLLMVMLVLPTGSPCCH